MGTRVETCQKGKSLIGIILGRTKHKDPVCVMQFEEGNAFGRSKFEGRMICFCSPGCKEKFDADPAQFKKHGINVMEEPKRRPFIIAFGVTVVIFLALGGASLSGYMMNGGMMGQEGWSGGFGWMWMPTLLTLGIGVLLGRMIFGDVD